MAKEKLRKLAPIKLLLGSPCQFEAVPARRVGFTRFTSISEA